MSIGNVQWLSRHITLLDAIAMWLGDYWIVRYSLIAPAAISYVIANVCACAAISLEHKHQGIEWPLQL